MRLPLVALLHVVLSGAAAAPTGQKWLCLPTGTADLNGIAMSQDGSAAVTFDTDGRILWIDLDLARNAMKATFNHPSDDLIKK